MHASPSLPTSRPPSLLCVCVCVCVCVCAQALNLAGSPVSEVDNYRQEVLLCVPQLTTLDGDKFTGEDRAAAAEEGVRRQEERAAREREEAEKLAGGGEEPPADDE